MGQSTLVHVLNNLLGKSLVGLQYVYVNELTELFWQDNSIIFDFDGGEQFQFCAEPEGVWVLPIKKVEDIKLTGEWIPDAQVKTNPVSQVNFPQTIHSITVHSIQPNEYVFMIIFEGKLNEMLFALVFGANEIELVVDRVVIENTFENHRLAFELKTIRIEKK